VETGSTGHMGVNLAAAVGTNSNGHSTVAIFGQARDRDMFLRESGLLSL